MSGKSVRDKGRRGEVEAKRLLSERDYTILADTTAGLESDDLVVLSPGDEVLSVEVKNTKSINVPAYLAQARKNAGKNAWMLMCKIDQSSSWLIFGKNRVPVVWHQRKKTNGS